MVWGKKMANISLATMIWTIFFSCTNLKKTSGFGGIKIKTTHLTI